MSQSLLNIKGVLSASIDAGIKNNDALDLSVIYLTETTATAAVFTQNVFCAAPVVIAKNHLNHHPKALLINSGNANAGTGTQGMKIHYTLVRVWPVSLILISNKCCHFQPV